MSLFPTYAIRAFFLCCTSHVCLSVFMGFTGYELAVRTSHDKTNHKSDKALFYQKLLILVSL